MFNEKPNKEELRAIRRDVFIRKNLKNGERYLVKVRKDLTEKLMNINPTMNNEMRAMQGKYIIAAVIHRSDSGTRLLSEAYEWLPIWLEDYKFLG